MRVLQIDTIHVVARSPYLVLFSRLGALQEADARIGDVRGRGAMVAVEFVKEGTHEPDPALASAVAKGCIAQGVVVLTCGTYGNIIRFLPPLTIPDALLAEGLDVVESVLKDIP